MSKVLITPQTLAGLEGPHLEVLRQAGFEPVFPAHPVQLTEEDLLRSLQGVAAAIAGSEPYTRRVIEANPSLRVIARAGVGFDGVDLTAATERGVAVTIAPNTNQDSVAEHTFALILGLAKDLVAQHLAVRAGGWPRKANLPLRGRTLGIVGLGRIGKAVARRGAAFGMRLLAYEPFPDAAFVQSCGVTLVPLEQLLAEADFVTLHVPLTAASRYLINQKTLALMKPTAFLINTARGGLVCEADLLEALRERRIAGAALDVFEQEPTSAANPLFQLDNVLVTPHAAGVDLQSREDMAVSAAQAIVALSRGEWPAEKVVNPEVRARFRW
ncbi:MAG TPA: phosphoglycerate dehydrogenase [Gemmataceae bacterium]|jgi:D-3-phosphoglycerate dehydrogenase|nr:phosphoglycerate dehydrogenase [Gemmataceae bacterium]